MPLTNHEIKGIIFDILHFKKAFYKGCESLKNNTIFIICLFLLFTLFGVIVGIQLNTDVPSEGDDFNFSLNREAEAREIAELKKANEDTKNKILDLGKLIDQYEQEKITDSIPLSKLRNEMQHYRFLSGHTAAAGPGMVITIEGMMGDNIAPLMEEKKYLMTLVNELKIFGGEVLSVNNVRLTARSEITLAGSHINVHTLPVAPPYVIQVIGNVNSLKRYVEHQTFIFEFMKVDGLQVNIEYLDDIKIPSIIREKPLQFIRPIEEGL